MPVISAIGTPNTSLAVRAVDVLAGGERLAQRRNVRHVRQQPQLDLASSPR